MALRVFTRASSAADFTNTPCATLDAVRNAIRDAMKDTNIADCIAEDDTRTIMAERWFIPFIGRRGLTG